MWRAAVRALGADPDGFRLILATSLKIDFRTARTARGGRGNPFAGILVSYAALGTILAMLLGARPLPPLTFAAALFTLSMMNTLLAVLMDFHLAILAPEDAEVVGTRPVATRTYFLARLCNFLFYVGAIGVALNLGPAVVLWARGDPAFGAGVLAAGVLAGFFCAGAVVLLYGLVIRLSDIERLKDLLVIVQVMMTLTLIGVYQLVGRADRLAGTDFGSGGWQAAPPVWFGALAALAAGETGGERLWLAAAACASATLAALLPLPLMSFRYSEYLGSLKAMRRRTRAAGPPAPGPPAWARWLVSPGEWRFFRFCGMQALRDRAVKMRGIPMALFPLLFLAWALARGTLDNPFEAAAGPVASATASFTFLVPFFVVLGAANLVFVMQTSEHHAAAWVFRAAPIERPAEVVRGWHSLILFGVAAPLLAVMGVASAIAWRAPAEAFLNAALFWLLADAAVSMSMLALVKDFPFARQATRGEGSRYLLIYFALMAAVGGLTALQFAAYRAPAVLPGYALGLLAACVALRRAAGAIVGRRLRI
jgi:hypothetical protein